MARDRLVQSRVARVDQPVELATAPARHDVEADVQGPGHAPQGGQRHGSQVAALHHRDEGSRDGGPVRDILLAPSASQPDRPEGGAHAFVVHGREPYGYGLIGHFAGQGKRMPSGAWLSEDQPPSTRSVCPVMNAASGPATKRMAAAT
ncbi:hypothetical protein BH23CHL8_BH23CHL8_21470 [soil metagenome]